LAQHRKSIIKAVLDRLDERMVLEQSRGKFHSYQDLYHTHKAYKEHALIFANWVRATYGIKRIEDLDEHIRDLTDEFLRQRTEEGESAYTLHLIRATLHTLFADPTRVQKQQQSPSAPDGDAG
jgi:hypothetical protein